MRKDSFTYVFIPADVSEPIQQLELKIPSKEREVECLLDKLKEHFRQRGAKSEAQRERQKAELLAKIAPDRRPDNIGAMLDIASDLTMAESVGLLNHAPDNGFVGVNMYVDDSGALKELPTNVRASELVACCGNPVQVHGDAFLARVRDDGDDFERMDFDIGEVSSSAAWVQMARAQTEKRRKAESAESVMQRLEQKVAGGAGASGSGGSSGGVQIKELSPAEQAKDDGNAAFKRGDNEEAAQHYTRALELDPGMAAARNNRAMAFLRLQRWADAKADCDAVLGADGGGASNVKALLRRATARRHLGDRDGSADDLKRALQLQPNNKEAQQGLAELEGAAAAAAIGAGSSTAAAAAQPAASAPNASS